MRPASYTTTKGYLVARTRTDTKTTETVGQADDLVLIDETTGAFPLPGRLPHIPFPLPTPLASGLYLHQRAIRLPFGPPGAAGDSSAHAGGDLGTDELTPIPDGPLPAGPLPRGPLPGPFPTGRPIPVPFPRRPKPRTITHELRLDVDGYHPQGVASGVVRTWLVGHLHWIAELTQVGTNQWEGPIGYKDGDSSLLAHTHVRITVNRSFFPGQQVASAQFTGGGAPTTMTFRHGSPYFHPVEFEFDCEQGQTATTSVQTHAHPNRPATLPSETLTIDTVFRRSGFDVRSSGGANIIPSATAGANTTWSDQEMHDAMQVHWSRFTNAAQWSIWVLFARQHDRGSSLGGIMFDDIGPNHRQGTAMFNESFISQAPAGDADPTAWVRRMRFWTAVHEMGHAFNLAHSWQKALGTPWRVPLGNEPEARSFMNYPYFVSGGQASFFADFDYRFSDAELLFLRHAPERYVQPGNADWFDHHGFEQADVSAQPSLALNVRVNRERAVFEFLEPVIVELKLENTSTSPQLVDSSLLSTQDHMTVIIKRQGREARQFHPYARYCLEPRTIALQPGEAIYEALPIFAGTNGWDAAEPGRYEVQIALHRDEDDLVSDPLTFVVRPPRDDAEEDLASAVFTEEVGRTLVFDGTRVLAGANETLDEVTERLPDRRIAIHARYALAAPEMEPTKTLEVRDGQSRIVASEGESSAAVGLADTIGGELDEAAETFGHILFHRRMDHLAEVLSDQGEGEGASRANEQMRSTLEDRGVPARFLEEETDR